MCGYRSLPWAGALSSAGGVALASVPAHESCPGPAPGSPGHREASLQARCAPELTPTAGPSRPGTPCAGAEGQGSHARLTSPAPSRHPALAANLDSYSTRPPPIFICCGPDLAPPGRDGLLLAKPRLLDPSCRPSLHPPTQAPQRLHRRRPWEECGSSASCSDLGEGRRGRGGRGSCFPSLGPGRALACGHCPAVGCVADTRGWTGTASPPGACACPHPQRGRSCRGGHLRGKCQPGRGLFLSSLFFVFFHCHSKKKKKKKKEIAQRQFRAFC